MYKSCITGNKIKLISVFKQKSIVSRVVLCVYLCNYKQHIFILYNNKCIHQRTLHMIMINAYILYGDRMGLLYKQVG